MPELTAQRKLFWRAANLNQSDSGAGGDRDRLRLVSLGIASYFDTMECCFPVAVVFAECRKMCINRLLITPTNVSVTEYLQKLRVCAVGHSVTRPKPMKDFHLNLNLICGLARQGCWNVKYEVLNELRTRQMSQLILCDNPHSIFHIKCTI